MCSYLDNRMKENIAKKYFANVEITVSKKLKI